MPFLILYGLGAKGQVDPKALVCSRSGLFAAPTAHHQRHAAAATRRSPGCAVRLQVSKPPGPRVAATWCVAWHGFRVPSSRTRLDENDSRVTGSGEFLRDLEPGGYCCCRSLLSRLGRETTEESGKKGWMQPLAPRPRPISCDDAPQRSRILMSFPGEATAARVQHAAFCASVCTASRLEEAQRGDGMDGREWRGGEGRAGTAWRNQNHLMVAAGLGFFPAFGSISCPSRRSPRSLALPKSWLVDVEDSLQLPGAAFRAGFSVLGSWDFDRVGGSRGRSRLKRESLAAVEKRLISAPAASLCRGFVLILPSRSCRQELEPIELRSTRQRRHPTLGGSASKAHAATGAWCQEVISSRSKSRTFAEDLLALTRGFPCRLSVYGVVSPYLPKLLRHSGLGQVNNSTV